MPNLRNFFAHVGLLLLACVAHAHAQVPVNAFGSTAANTTACGSRGDYMRFYALMSTDLSAASAFASDHKCIRLEGDATVRVDQIVRDTSCVRPSGAPECVWTSSDRINPLVDAKTKAIQDKGK
jgi:hypothetical protein